MARIYTWIGILLETLAGFGLLGWLQGSDPDCILDSGLLLQIRMCDPLLLGQPQQQPLAYLAMIGVLGLIGLLCLRFGQHYKSIENQ